MKTTWLVFLLGGILIFVWSCSGLKKHDTIVIQQNDYTLVLPAGFDTFPVPEDNQFSLARIELGKRLFFDTSLSLDYSISCATCHQPDQYFTDGHPKSVGINNQIVDRNSPSLFNVAYQTSMLREGGVPTIEMQVLVPVQEHKEFNFNMVKLAERLREDSSYNNAAKRTYGREIDPYVITRAIANYERTLVSGNSAFDQYYYQGKKNALSKDEKTGYELFKSERLNCVKCHSGFNFTNYSITNNGLYDVYSDPGKGRLTTLASDSGTFKVPSLRNVAMTAPYMHDGSLSTIDQVIEHYASGGKNHPNKSELIKEFTLSPTEKKQLKAFLESLTDYSVVAN